MDKLVAIVHYILENKWLGFLLNFFIWGMFFGFMSHSWLAGALTGMAIAVLQRYTQYSLSRVRVSRK